MKLRVYVVILLVLLPFQARLLSPLSLSGITPDLGLTLLFIIGLLTSPPEAAAAGVCIGLVQDIGSASFIGLSGLLRGLMGLGAGILGSRVLDIGSPAMVLFLAVFSLVEGIFITLFLQAAYGDVPFFSLIGGRLVPQAIYTGVLGSLLLRLARRKNILAMLTRRDLQKEP